MEVLALVADAAALPDVIDRADALLGRNVRALGEAAKRLLRDGAPVHRERIESSLLQLGMGGAEEDGVERARRALRVDLREPLHRLAADRGAWIAARHPQQDVGALFLLRLRDHVDGTPSQVHRAVV